RRKHEREHNCDDDRQEQPACVLHREQKGERKQPAQCPVGASRDALGRCGCLRSRLLRTRGDSLMNERRIHARGWRGPNCCCASKKIISVRRLRTLAAISLSPTRARIAVAARFAAKPRTLHAAGYERSASAHFVP